ncbi:RHTO0S07e02740g1_1 [Rhodotorula toruloides]|uniref:RHTO0S07e02740g1_1 n=2 Tax=Rhodotorula toruloides TaxID=5286 RepID=A0A061B6Z4_RHOTO|nr:uncharacterized protein RHTO_02785 [Rhodotorula toruloides NP11]EMS25058.1 hypothetical protein RHTO_02785 [Rhodotorula toruloides NP11]CDR42665.1 RHTO0S07e02740g1_1 [Rhodotorula toruloides]
MHPLAPPFALSPPRDLIAAGKLHGDFQRAQARAKGAVRLSRGPSELVPSCPPPLAQTPSLLLLTHFPRRSFRHTRQPSARYRP